MYKRGIALISIFIIIAVLAVMGSAIVSRSVSERITAQRYTESTQAFWLAEAGVNRALVELRNTTAVSPGENVWSGTLAGVEGEYSIDLGALVGQTRTVTTHGYIPSRSSPHIERIIQTEMSSYIPSDFYDYAVYSADDVDFNGDSYSVTAKDGSSSEKAVIYADEESIEHPENITGTTTEDSSISPLARLDFQDLHDISEWQGNIYDADRLKEVQKGNDSFPATFWNPGGSDGVDNDGDISIDEADEMVNIVYVETDLALNGDIGTIGGFYVVVGDVITNPDGTYDATINGSGQIDGVVYTRGEFRVNGGGGGLNVNGGVWAGELTRLNGNAHVAYNESYMNSIDALDVGGEVQVISWIENPSPYPLTN